MALGSTLQQDLASVAVARSGLLSAGRDAGERCGVVGHIAEALR